MSEFAITLLLIGTETAGFLLLVVGVFIFIKSRQHKKDKGRAMELVNKIKKDEPARKENIKELLKESYGLDEETAGVKTEDLMHKENQIYTKILRMYMGRDRDAILGLDKDFQKLIEDYRDLAEPDDSDPDKPSSPVIVRQENKKLREEKKQLETDLASAMQTMENMMSEYASMYEGGQKEGEQRVKNEMFKLQQKLSEKVELDDEVDVEIPDLDDIVDVDDDELK